MQVSVRFYNKNPQALLKHWYIVSKKGKQITKSHESPHLMTTPAWHRWWLYGASTKCKLSLSLITVTSTTSLLNPLRGPGSQLSHVRVLLLFPGCLSSCCRPGGFRRRNIRQADRWPNVQHLLVQGLLFVKLKFFTKGVQFSLKLIFVKLLMYQRLKICQIKQNNTCPKATGFEIASEISLATSCCSAMSSIMSCT